jgi:hypothetical protein
VIKATILVTLTAGMVATGAASAFAQGEDYPVKTGFVAVYGGAQPQRRTVTATESLPLYDETATITSILHVRNAGVVEFAGGARVRGPLVAGARFSMFGRPGTSTVSASIPDPVIYNRPRTVVTDAADLKHTERGLHLYGMWFTPITDKIDLGLSAGPSFIHVAQAVTNVTVQTGTQNITPVNVTQTGNAVGFNAGVDATYRLSPQYGLGLFLHYATASLDLPAIADLKVGGVQTGLGFHVRF